MRSYIALFILFLSFSCTSRSQERRDFSLEPADSLPQKITLLFAGDLMQHITQIAAARTPQGEYDYSSYFSLVKDEISRADIAVANLEVTLGGKPYAGYPQFSAPDEYLTAIKEAGFDVLLTANNHSLDRRQQGLERTIARIDSAQLRSVGTYINKEERNKRYPLLLEQNGFRIALLTYTYGTNGIEETPPNIVNYIDKEVMAADIAAARALTPDAIIACMHWGLEYKSLPSKEEVELTDWLLGQGVTHVIGGHPHVVQPLELRTDSIDGSQHLVVYSLGNLISNMSARRTDGGLLVKLELTKDSVVRVSQCAYSLVWVGRPGVIHGKNHQLYPAGYPSDSLPVNARNAMKVFMDDSRALFRKYNKGIEEYQFY